MKNQVVTVQEEMDFNLSERWSDQSEINFNLSSNFELNGALFSSAILRGCSYCAITYFIVHSLCLCSLVEAKGRERNGLDSS